MYSTVRPAQAGPSNSAAGTCAFCRQGFSTGLLPPVTHIACGHIVHTHCLNRWLPTVKMCPVCRFPIPKWSIRCLLCSQPFKCGASIISNECDHHFHEQCILRHLQRYKTCPVCQTPRWTNWTMTVKKCNHCNVCVLPPDQQCTICLTKLVNGDVVKKLPCAHEFHDACLNPWLDKHLTCPLCRTEVVESTATS